MRLLHIVQRYAPFRGGSELVFGELSERARAEGHAVTVYTTDAWDLEYFWSGRFRRLAVARETIAGVPVVRWPVHHLPWRLGELAYPILRRLMTHLSDLPLPGRIPLLELAGGFSPWVPTLVHHLRQVENPDSFDLVHVCNVTFESLMQAGRDYARRAGIPLVVTPLLHLGEPHDRRVRKYYSMAHQMALVRSADAVIALTTIERDFLIGQGVAADRIAVIQPGVDPAAIAGGDGQRLRQRLGLGDEPIIFTIGANAYDKGMIHLVEAVGHLWDEQRSVTLVIAGPRLSHFDRFLAGLPAARRARLRVLGVISDEERRDLFAAGTIFALPSRTDSYAVVFLEAWSVGLPVVGANAGGIPGVIRDGVDGLLVSFGDVPALATALRRLLDDPALAHSLGAAGRSTLPQRSWPAFYQSIRDLYARLIRSETMG